MSMCLSNALDLVSSRVVDHHKRVAYIACSIAAEMGMPEDEREVLMLAGLLHDIGAISARDRIETLQFELENPDFHAELGYRFIRTFDLFLDVAQLVRFHHVPWDNGRGGSRLGQPVPDSSHVLHLADRIAVLIDKKREILCQTDRIKKAIRCGSGSKFVPEYVDAFIRLSEKESFWFDTVSPAISDILKAMTGTSSIVLTYDLLHGMIKLFGRIIDFRSRFTATHSSGVAATASALARMAGMKRSDCDVMRIAGYLHDLGKLAVPAEILEKPGRLSVAETNIVKNHPYHTYRIIGTVRGLDTINQWASLHHECIDGRGYPFHHCGDEISLGSRIMAVADVFTALSEDRPYRPGMSRHDALQTMQTMAGRSALDGDLVSLVGRRYGEINAMRVASQTEESGEYEEFGAGLSQA
ncbi:MAG: HD domain-containing protein [Nitrospirae bacterium]|nr:MAG: HD domain-containing protein [Nitrospirota bacterium]